MLENFIMHVRDPKGVLGGREAFVSRGARASAAARSNDIVNSSELVYFQNGSISFSPNLQVQNHVRYFMYRVILPVNSDIVAPVKNFLIYRCLLCTIHYIV